MLPRRSCPCRGRGSRLRLLQWLQTFALSYVAASYIAVTWTVSAAAEFVASCASVIRIEAIWLDVDMLDRPAPRPALARVVRVCAARPIHAYLFTNRRANRLKVLCTTAS